MKQHRFKKLTALILSAVMLLSLVPVTALGSTGDVQEVISLTYLGETDLYEGSDQAVMYDENGELSWVTYSYLTYAEYEITYVRVDGTRQTEQLSGYEISNMTEGAFQITGEHNGNTPWKAGETYHATVTAVGVECQVTLTIQKHPIQSIEYAGSEPIVLVKGEDGSPMSDGGWYYEIGNRSDIKFSVDLYSDGSTSSFTGSVGEIWEKANATLQFYYDHSQDENEITKAWVGRDGLVCPVDVKIYPNGSSFTGITPVSSDPVELEESIDGYSPFPSDETDETEYFIYTLRWTQAMPQFTVKLSDVGMKKYGMATGSFTGTIEEIEGRFGIVVQEESKQATPDMPDGERWTADDGQQHTIKLVLPGGASCDVPVTIVPPVDTSLFAAVSLKDPDEVFVLQEGADAQYCINGKFMYDPLIRNDPTFVVTLTEYGKTHLGFSSDTVEMTANDIYSLGSYFMLNDGAEETVMNYQVGHSYDYVIYLDGTLPCTLKVRVEEEPQVKSVSCLPNPVLLFENYDFNREYGCSADQAMWDGRVQFKVELNNGDSFTGTYNEIWNQLGFGPICDRSSNLTGEQCTVGETHEFVLYLGGKSCTFEGTLTAGTEVELNEDDFPDEVFRQYLTDYYDFDGDGVIVAEAVNSIYCYGMGIESLAGIEKFPMLASLYCGDNQLTALDVSKNTALQSLDCSGNQLTALDVSNNTALQSLYCGHNQLTALDVGKNTALEGLYCGENQLTALDVSKNTALQFLYCYNNKVTALDVSKNIALQSLDCGDNQLTVLVVSNNKELLELSCYNNPLTALNVSNNTALVHLNCYNNQLTALDVSKNTKLKYLYCSCNSLSNLDVSGCPGLEELECAANTKHLTLNVAKLEKLNLTTVGTDLTLNVMGQPAQGTVVSGYVQFHAINALELTLTDIKDSETFFATYAIGDESGGTGQYRFYAVPNGTYTLTAKSWYDDAVPYTRTVTVANGVVSGLPESFLLARRGDVTLDGIIDVYDLQRLYEHVNRLKELTGYALAVADVNNDSDSTILDVQRLYDILTGNYGAESSKTG